MTAVVELPRPGSLRAWLLATRPKTLTAALVPVMVGTSAAYHAGAPQLSAALAALFGALCLQVTTNLANDLFDHEKGADTDARLGPPRAAQLGLLTPRMLRRALMVTLGLALLSGLYLVHLAGPAVVAIGLVSMVAAVAYTAGPYPLAYVGLGDVFVWVFFGFVAVAGTAFVQLGSVPAIAWFTGGAVGAFATVLLTVNNVRDRATDAAAHKRTLVARFGRRFGELESLTCLTLGFLLPAVPIALGIAGPALLLPSLAVPLAVRLQRDLRRLDGAELNGVLAQSARLLFVHGTLLALGITADAWLRSGP